jgi:hypothetical protein
MMMWLGCRYIISNNEDFIVPCSDKSVVRKCHPPTLHIIHGLYLLLHKQNNISHPQHVSFAKKGIVIRWPHWHTHNLLNNNKRNMFEKSMQFNKMKVNIDFFFCFFFCMLTAYIYIFLKLNVPYESITKKIILTIWNSN